MSPSSIMVLIRKMDGSLLILRQVIIRQFGVIQVGEPKSICLRIYLLIFILRIPNILEMITEIKCKITALMNRLAS